MVSKIKGAQSVCQLPVWESLLLVGKNWETFKKASSSIIASWSIWWWTTTSFFDTGKDFVSQSVWLNHIAISRAKEDCLRSLLLFLAYYFHGMTFYIISSLVVYVIVVKNVWTFFLGECFCKLTQLCSKNLSLVTRIWTSCLWKSNLSCHGAICSCPR